jgi:hypothetical protein
MWNRLPGEVVNAKNLNCFKAQLDSWLDSEENAMKLY